MGVLFFTLIGGIAMSNEELVTFIKSGIDVRDNMERLYEQCEGYIEWVAKKYIGYFDIEDLMQEGYIALNNAVYDFNVSIDQRFTAWLHVRLLRQFEQYRLYNKRGMVNGNYHNTYIRRYLKLKKYFNAIYGRDPDMREYVAYLRKPVDTINKIKLMAFNDNTVSLETPTGEEDNLTLGSVLPNNDNTEDTVIDKIMEDDLKTGLWEIVRDTVNEDEFGVIKSVFVFNMPLDKCALQRDTTRYDVTNSYYSGMGKLQTHKVKKKIADRFEINYAKAFRTGVRSFKNTFTSATESVAISNIEEELSYIKYVLTAAKDGVELLSQGQVNLAKDHGLLSSDFEVCINWEVPKHGLAAEPIYQYDLDGKLIKRWDSAHEAVEQTGATIDGIRRCLLGYRNSSGGFIWKRVDNREVAV